MKETQKEKYLSLIKKARRKEKYVLIKYLKYRLQERKAIFTEIFNKYAENKLSILESIETRKEKNVSFADFQKINGERIVLN